MDNNGNFEYHVKFVDMPQIEERMARIEKLLEEACCEIYQITKDLSHVTISVKPPVAADGQDQN